MIAAVRRRSSVLVAALALIAGGAFVLPFARAGEGATAKIGHEAPDFTLTDLSGKTHTLSDYAGKVVVLEWFNPQCPFVVKHHETRKTMPKLYAKYKDRVVWLAINSNAPGKQGSGAALNKAAQEEWKIEYPLLLDPTSEVARRYAAKTTPHMYVIDAQGTLRYDGAIDDERGIKAEPKVNYVERALDAVLAGKEVEQAKTKPYGCSVKYAAAN